MRIVILITALAMAGCATSKKEIQSDENRYSFTVKENYQIVLKRLVEQRDNCVEDYLMIGGFKRDASLNEDQKQARISRTAPGNKLVEVINLKGLEDGSTRVDFYSGRTGSTRAAEEKRHEYWANGGTECRVP